MKAEWPTSKLYAQSSGVQELPDIKIFRHSRPHPYEAGAGKFDLVDVARWNAGNIHLTAPGRMRADGTREHGLHSHAAVAEIEATSGFEKLLTKHRLVLIAFTTRWCSRCLMLHTEFDAAAALLATADPPVTLANVNIDNPRNKALVDRFNVLMFPVGKIFHRGRLLGDFTGGTLAHEIITEMMTVRRRRAWRRRLEPPAAAHRVLPSANDDASRVYTRTRRR